MECVNPAVDHVPNATRKLTNADHRNADAAKSATLRLPNVKIFNVDHVLNAIESHSNANQYLVMKTATNATLRMECVNPAVDHVPNATRKLTNADHRNADAAKSATLRLPNAKILNVDHVLNAIL